MIELRILGAFDLRATDGATLDEALRRSKRIALLAYVAAARPLGFHRRDKLAALFWPELDKERARGALRTTLSRLRDDLGDDVVESRGAEEIAVRRDRLWCDVVALHECLARNDAIGTAELYRGEMLDGVHIPGTADEFEQWISEERAAIRAGVLGVLSAEADRLLAGGDPAGALAAASRASLVAPDDESTARRLIRIALDAGDRGAALRAYEEIERVLRREYDVAPSGETESLIAPLRGATNGGSTPPPPRNGRSSPKPDSSLPPHDGSAPPVTDEPGLDPAPDRGRSPARLALVAALLLLVIVATWKTARIGMVAGSPAASSTGTWRRISSSAGSAPARHHGGATLDSSGEGLLVMGGARSIGYGQQTMEPMNTELWRLVGLRAGAASQWVRVPIRDGPAPKPKWQFGSAFDVSADRWFVHGGAQGWSSPCSNDTWALERASGIAGQPAWHSVTVRGPLPPPRAGFQLSFDRTRRKLIVFGGNDCINEYFHDTWVLTFDDSTFVSGVWSRLFPDSTQGQPVTRNGYVAAYDTTSARLFIFGGMTPGSRVTSELWVLDHADGASGSPRWHALACAGEAPPLTSPLSAYDERRDSWMIFSGTGAGGPARRVMWRVDGLMRDTRACRWTRVPFSEPWPLERTAGMAAVVRGGSDFLIFGGYVDIFSVSDAWVFTDSTRR